LLLIISGISAYQYFGKPGIKVNDWIDLTRLSIVFKHWKNGNTPIIPGQDELKAKNLEKDQKDASIRKHEGIGETTPQTSTSGIQVKPLFPSSPPQENNVTTIPTLQFNSKDNDGWVKRQDIDLWIKPAPPYNEPPQTLEAKGAWLLDKADPINFKVKQRLAVYKTPDINSSIDYYLEPGQAAQIYEGYEKTIRPGVIHLKNDWKDPDTNAVYKAGENINFYVYQEGGCYWFMYSLKTNGQLGDGYCPHNGGEVGDVDNGENWLL
jgi:hypothetical protein